MDPFYIITYLEIPELLKLSGLNKSWTSAISKEFLKRVYNCEISDNNRKQFWLSALPIQKTMQNTYFMNENLSYQQIQLKISQGHLTNEKSPFMSDEILRDIPRTYFVQMCGKDWADILYRVLFAVGCMLPDVGYCQGMNFIAGAFYYVLQDEEMSFWAFLALITQYNMENLFVSGVPDLHMRVFQVNKCLEKFAPTLYHHFKREGMNNTVFSSKWIMTIFSVNLHVDVLVHVWDLFFLRGWKVVYQVGVALLLEFEQEILALSIEEMASYFRDGSREEGINKHHLLNTAESIKVTKSLLDNLENEFFIDQAFIKLKAIDKVQFFSKDELEALHRAKAEFDKFDPPSELQISEFMEKIEVVDREIEQLEQDQSNTVKTIETLKSWMSRLNGKLSKYHARLPALQQKVDARRIAPYGSENTSEFSFSFTQPMSFEEPTESDVVAIRNKIGKAEKMIAHLNTEYRQLWKDLNTDCINLLKQKKATYKSQLEGFIFMYQARKNDTLLRLSKCLNRNILPNY